MNLLMLAPLLDSQGNLRYYLGAQIDVSGLVKSGTDLEAFRRMLDKKESEVRRKRKQRVGREGSEKENDDPKDEFQELCEMFNNAELDTVRKFGGSMHRELLSSSDNNQRSRHRQRNREHQPSSSDENEPPETSPPAVKSIGQLSNVYKHVRYILSHSVSPATAPLNTCTTDTKSISTPQYLIYVSSPQKKIPLTLTYSTTPA